MNYTRLLSKYRSEAKYVIHDRSYHGIEWCTDEVEKPSMEQFEAWSQEEERLGRVESLADKEKISRIDEIRRLARIKAIEAAKPLEAKIAEEWKAIHESVIGLRKELREQHEARRAKDALSSCWKEIDSIQAGINAEAEQYLKDTDWVATRKQDTGKDIPEDIMQKREEARSRIQHGSMVYANWEKLRSLEMPKKEEIIAALRAGHEEVERIKKVIEGIRLKFPKPGKPESWRK